MNLKRRLRKKTVYSSIVDFSFYSIVKLISKPSPLFLFLGILFLALYLLPAQEAYAGLGMNIKSGVVLASAANILLGIGYFFYDAYFLNPNIQIISLPEYYIEYKLADQYGNLKEDSSWDKPTDFFDGTHTPEEPFFLRPANLVTTKTSPYSDKISTALKTVVWEYGKKLTNEADRKRFRDNLHAYSTSCIGVGKLSPQQQLEHSLSTCISSIAKQSKKLKFKNSFAVKAQTSENVLELAEDLSLTYPVFEVVDSELANLSIWITANSVSALTESKISLLTSSFPAGSDDSENEY